MMRTLFVVAAVMVVAGCRGSAEALLVRVDSETAGDNCAQGGVAIRTGYDTNNSQTLDDSEIDASKTKYVCNGASGTSGQPGAQGDAGVSGHNSLNKVTAEAAGLNCENGGSKIETGVDLDDNGTLDAGEVTATSYVCSQSAAEDYYFGDITIRSDDDLAELAGKRVLFGSIVIEHATAGDLTLADLEAVTGDVVLGTVNGGEGPALRALTPVRELHLPKLASAAGLYLNDYPELTVLDLPVLARAGEVRVEYMSGLTTISLPQLKRTNTLSVRQNDTVASVNLPMLTVSRVFEIEYNDVLASVTVLSTLAVLDELDVYGNELLNDCFAHALQLNAAPRWGTDIYDNLPTAMCTAAQVCAPVTGVMGLSDFYQCNNRLAFAAAQTFCATIATGASLAWFESAAEWTAFSSAVYDGQLFSDAWIGYSDQATEGTWVASGGGSTYDPVTDTTITFWAPGEPNDTTHGENAAQIHWSGRVNDGNAMDAMRFYCRVP